jgi:hypothetical protein
MNDKLLSENDFKKNYFRMKLFTDIVFKKDAYKDREVRNFGLWEYMKTEFDRLT